MLAAAARGDCAAVQLLAQTGIDVDEASSTGRTALMAAAHAGHQEIVRILLENGASPDMRDGTYGTTALMLACANGHNECTQLLFSRDTTLANQQDLEGRNALLYAARRGHSSIVAMLCSAPEVCVDMADETGLTPLMAASQTNNLDAIRELISGGASLHAEDTLGMNALHAACRAGAVEACNELLRLGARADAVDEDGLLPIDHCDPDGPRYSELCDMLLAAQRLLDAIAASGSSPAPPTSIALQQAGLEGPVSGHPHSDDDYWDNYSFKSYDSRQDDRPWH